MTRREYLRRKRRRQRRIFYLCAVIFIAVLLVLLGVLFSRLLNTSQEPESSAPSPNQSARTDTGKAGDPQSTDPSSISIPGYEIRQMSEEDIHAGTLLLINGEHEYTFSENKKMVSMYDIMNEAYDVAGTDVVVDEAAAQPLFQLLNDFYQQSGLNTINILCGYRTKEESQQLFDASAADNGLEHAKKFVALPGYSEHHSALSVDLGLMIDGYSDDYTGAGEYSWINENCYRYGFIVRYPADKNAITKIDYEPWHFRYLGVPNATAVVKEGLCYEEYIDFIKNYTADGTHYQVATADGNYEIYYASGTQVPVPADQAYEISGNNLDGFIVTVKVG